MAEDRRNSHGVDAGGLPRLAARRFPDARFACLVGPSDFVELGPFCFGGGERRDAVDYGGAFAGHLESRVESVDGRSQDEGCRESVRQGWWISMREAGHVSWVRIGSFRCYFVVMISVFRNRGEGGDMVVVDRYLNLVLSYCTDVIVSDWLKEGKRDCKIYHKGK